MKSLLRSPTALLTIVLMTSPASAQGVLYAADLQEAGKAIDLLDGITITATRRAEKAFDLPTAVTVITANQIKERSQTSFADLFKGETGIFVRATNPSAGSPIIRGVTGRDVLLLVDGFRLSHAFMRPNTQYEGLVDPFFVDQVELVRGPGSVLYGSDALGGISNVLTANYRPGDPTFEAHTEFGTNPVSSSSHLRVSGGSEQWNSTLGLTYRTFGDVVLGNNPNPQVFFPNPGRTVADSGYEYYGGNFKTVWQLAPAQTLSLTAQYSQIPTVSRQDSIIQGYGSEVPAAERGFAPQSRTFILGEYKAAFKDTWLDALSWKVGFQRVEDNRFQRRFTNPPSFPLNDGILSDNTTLEKNASNLWGTVLDLTSTLNNHRFTYGLEAYFDRVTSARDIRNDLIGTTPSADGPRYVDGSTFNQYGFFAQDEIAWDDRFSSNLGVRYSVVDIQVPFSDLRPLSSNFSRNFQSFTGSIGLSYKVQPALNLVLNVGQGFRAPNINDLAEAGARRASDINTPNPNLIPEKVFSIDGGLKWNTANFSGEFIGFWSHYTDRIDSVSLGTVLNADGTTSEIFQTQNRNTDTIWGGEFGSRYRFNDQWSAFATATLTFADSGLSGETAIPPINGAVGVRYEPSTGVYIEPYLRYASSQNNLSANDLTDVRINPDGTPGFVVANIRAGLPLGPTTTLRLNMDNLFNSTYREHASSLDGAGFGVTVGLDTTF